MTENYIDALNVENNFIKVIIWLNVLFIQENQKLVTILSKIAGWISKELAKFIK